MQCLRCAFLAFAVLVVLASTYALRYGSARAAVLREGRKAWAKVKAAPNKRGCCAESLELRLPELPSSHLKVKWPKVSVKRGEVMEITVVNAKSRDGAGSGRSAPKATRTRAKGEEGTNVLVWLVSSDGHQLAADVAAPVAPGRWSAHVGPLQPGKWTAHVLAITLQGDRILGFAYEIERLI